jgi:hypothetical protein
MGSGPAALHLPAALLRGRWKPFFPFIALGIFGWNATILYAFAGTVSTFQAKPPRAARFPGSTENRRAHSGRKFIFLHIFVLFDILISSD